MSEENDNLYLDKDYITSQVIISYPKLVDRFKAMVVDGLIIYFIVISVGMTVGMIENTPGFVRGIIIISLFILYEPLLVSYGGTVGHRLVGLKVKSHKDSDKNVFFPIALLRSLIKWLLGWVSFITMLTNKEKRAIHDLLSNSIVLYREQKQ